VYIYPIWTFSSQTWILTPYSFELIMGMIPFHDTPHECMTHSFDTFIWLNFKQSSSNHLLFQILISTVWFHIHLISYIHHVEVHSRKKTAAICWPSKIAEGAVCVQKGKLLEYLFIWTYFYISKCSSNLRPVSQNNDITFHAPHTAHRKYWQIVHFFPFVKSKGGSLESIVVYWSTSLQSHY
jgi:hypothetical protein